MTIPIMTTPITGILIMGMTMYAGRIAITTIITTITIMATITIIIMAMRIIITMTMRSGPFRFVTMRRSRCRPSTCSLIFCARRMARSFCV